MVDTESFVKEVSFRVFDTSIRKPLLRHILSVYRQPDPFLSSSPTIVHQDLALLDPGM